MAETRSRILPDEWLGRYERSQLSRSVDGELTRTQSYLGIHSIILYVRDVEASLGFYVQQLGFQIVVDQQVDAKNRWVAVAPPDGSVLLALQRPENGPSREAGNRTVVSLETDDIEARFQEWSARGVHFKHPPLRLPWGILAIFLDLDGNELALIEGPWIAHLLTSHRRSIEERREAERLAAYEMDIAKQVQAGLFPQRKPAFESLEYAGACVQARKVGGDYYDFLDLGSGRLAIVVGDISGKGMAAALLMANLQACLRSQYATALEDMPGLLESVNRLLCENTPDGSYATLLFVEYQERTGRLRYVNGGHLPGLLLRRDGTLERLDSTATVLGLFPFWTCSVGETKFESGDLLALYTDGITEATSEDGREFGEEGLVKALHEERHLPVERLLARIVERVQGFCGSEHADDETLVVARRLA